MNEQSSLLISVLAGTLKVARRSRRQGRHSLRPVYGKEVQRESLGVGLFSVRATRGPLLPFLQMNMTDWRHSYLKLPTGMHYHVIGC